MFVVCPESWRLRAIHQKKKRPAGDSSVEGQRLHSEWARRFEEAILLARSAKLLIPLLFAAILIHLILITRG